MSARRWWTVTQLSDKDADGRGLRRKLVAVMVLACERRFQRRNNENHSDLAECSRWYPGFSQ